MRTGATHSGSATRTTRIRTVGGAAVAPACDVVDGQTPTAGLVGSAMVLAALPGRSCVRRSASAPDRAGSGCCTLTRAG